MAREAAGLAAACGVETIWVFCESHARDISFGVVARLLRAATGVADLGGESARARARSIMAGADSQDLLLLDDLLGIADPDVALPAIDPDARRRRLTALVNSASLARARPVLVVVLNRLAQMRIEHESAMLEITILRLQALLARARADPAHLDLVDRYRAMAESLGYEGHIAWAQAMDMRER